MQAPGWLKLLGPLGHLIWALRSPKAVLGPLGSVLERFQGLVRLTRGDEAKYGKRCGLIRGILGNQVLGFLVLGFLVFDDLENQVLGFLVLGFLDLSKIRFWHSWILGSWILGFVEQSRWFS